jgi:agmatinase
MVSDRQKKGGRESNPPQSSMIQKVQTIPLNFGGIPREDSLWENSRVVFLPVPYDLTTTYLPGARRGPLAILEASTHLELFDEELGVEPCRVGFHTLEPLEAIASGPEEMVRQIQAYAEPVIRANKFPVLIGGEHTVTLGIVQALQGAYPKLSFLQLDAHADLRDTFEGTRFSHACVGRRLAEIGPLVQVGVRSMSLEESLYLKRAAIKSFFWHHLSGLSDWVEKVCQALSEEVYVTIDLDVLDPAIMPSVGTPEPGGLNWETLIQFLRRLAQRRRVVGFDVVELAPIPGLIAPDFLAAKLINRFLGYIFTRSPGGDRNYSAGKEI